mmetsp:Transcript_22788/g.53189  ORF Transcript_22788/g.53189 Transcript_22788/m.53189 type:complete len:286 (-) Transcript_22788:239-1096(-)
MELEFAAANATETRHYLSLDDCGVKLFWVTFGDILAATFFGLLLLHCNVVDNALHKHGRTPKRWLSCAIFLPFCAAIVIGFMFNDHPPGCIKPTDVHYWLGDSGKSLSIMLNTWIVHYGDLFGLFLVVGLVFENGFDDCLAPLVFWFGTEVVRVLSFLYIHECNCYLSDHLFFVSSILAQVHLTAQVVVDQHIAVHKEVGKQRQSPGQMVLLFVCLLVALGCAIESLVTATHFHTRLGDTAGGVLGLLTFVLPSLAVVYISREADARERSLKEQLLDEPRQQPQA